MPYKYKKDKLAHDTAYESTTEEKRRRAKRNAARKMLESEGKVSKGDGKDVHHKDGNPENNSKSNLAVTSHKQRGIKKA